MTKSQQIHKAERLLQLHHDLKVLILPNIWDPLGARLLQHMDYPAVATASAAVAFSLGYDDGENLTFTEMVAAVARIGASVDIPVSADIERGYARESYQLENNIRQLLQAGVVGINLEDSLVEGGGLRSIEEQCERIQTVRKAATSQGIPLVINARTDIYLRTATATDGEPDKLAETITRANAYLEAGADCIYPITLCDLAALKKLYQAIQAPINVFAMPGLPSIPELQTAGIARVSIGPGLIKAALTTMKEVALELKEQGTYDSFTQDVISSDEVRQIILGRRSKQSIINRQ